jgi:polysaccharide biosynthesis protein PslH
VKSPLRILYITSCWPHGRTFGGQLRTLHIGRALGKIGEVSLAVVSSDGADEETVRMTEAEFHLEPPVRIDLAINRSTQQRLRWAFDTHFLNVHGCQANAEDRARLLSRLREFDLVWLSNSRTPNILNQWRWPRSVMDIDDVPSTFQGTVWKNGASLKGKIKAGATMLLLKRRERSWKDRFNVLSVCSEADRQYLGGGSNIHVIPNGFERMAGELLRNPIVPPRIGFIGLYSYPPNLEGMNWFLRECWPLVKRQMPDAHLRLVGKDSDTALKPTEAGVDALGYLADATAEIATWSAMIVPILHGAGTRVKIAEAFSRKCPIVSTRVGAFGYDVESGRELLLADKPADFANACVSLARDQALGVAMADRGFDAFLKKWTWEAITPRIWATAEDALRKAGSTVKK